MIGVTRRGAEGAAPVVFLHGGVINRQMWLPVMEALGSDYESLAIDLPGHGSLSNQAFTMDACRDRVGQVLVEMGTTHVALVGLSLGGYVAQDFAAHRPDAVDGLVLAGATVRYTGWDAISTRFYGWVFPLLARRAENAFAEKLERDVEPRHARAILDTGLSMRGGSQALRRLPGPDYAAAMLGLDKPIVLANGERDKPNRAAEASFLEYHPEARSMMIPDAGHACALQRPLTFAEVVSSMMGEVAVT